MAPLRLAAPGTPAQGVFAHEAFRVTSRRPVTPDALRSLVQVASTRKVLASWQEDIAWFRMELSPAPSGQMGFLQFYCAACRHCTNRTSAHGIRV